MTVRITPFVAALTLFALAADDLLAQRRGRFRGRMTRPERAAPPEPETVEEEKPVEKWTAIRGADVHIGDGSVLTRATILIGDDEIHGVGHDVELPEGTEVLDATGMVVSPGFVAVKCRGLGAPFQTQESYADEVNPFDPSIKLGLAAGITSFLAMTGSPGTSPAGNSAIVKLSYGDLDGMVEVEDTVLNMRVPLDPQKLRDLREKVKKIREWQRKKDATPKGKDEPKAPSGTDQLRRIMDRKAKLWISPGGGGGFGRRGGGGGSRGDDRAAIGQALEIAELLGVGVILDDPICGWVLSDEIAATDSMVILNPRRKVQPDPGRPDDTGSNLASAAILADAGVPVAVTCPGGRFGGGGIGTGGILGQDLNTPHVDAAFAVRGGLDNRKALRTITLDAARALGIDDRVGSIEVGKDADLLILDGDPLHYRTFVQTAIVNGKVVYRKDEEPFYRHIQR